MSKIGLGYIFAIDLFCQGIGFALSAPLKTEKLYDLSGSLTFLACLATSYFKSPFHSRKVIVSAMTTLWTVRLGLFLGYRVQQHGKDDRFDSVKHDPIKFSGFWLVQAIWVFVTAFPVYTVNLQTKPRQLGIVDLVGIGIWTAGFGIESLADWQKLKWQQRMGEDRHKDFIKEGLWSLSRHPNYFGEVLLWTGNWLICSNSFSSWKIWGIFMTSPLFVLSLIYKVSGVPLLEKKADERFGHREDYQIYKQTVPEFFPWRLKDKLY